jgi:hypothetical protein
VFLDIIKLEKARFSEHNIGLLETRELHFDDRRINSGLR